MNVKPMVAVATMLGLALPVSDALAVDRAYECTVTDKDGRTLSAPTSPAATSPLAALLASRFMITAPDEATAKKKAMDEANKAHGAGTAQSASCVGPDTRAM
jgi:hypothetical protein